IEFYDKAQYHYSLIFYQTLSTGKLGAPTPGGQAEYYLDRAGWEINPQKKRESLEKSEKAGLEALKVAENWDIPIPINRMFHILSRTLTALARLEPDFEAKRSLLEKALKYRERNIEIWEQWAPFHYWNMGVHHDLLAQIKAELAFIQQDHSIKMRLLEDAALSKKKSLRFFDTIMPFYEKRGLINFFAPLSEYQDVYGKILSRLYEETKNPEHLRRAMGIWQRAIESASKLEMFSRIAESYWKIAKAQITMGEQTKAAESFERASESYGKAAEKIPQLKDFYQEYASYMRAWSEFEKAKQNHTEKRYLIAKEHYENAAELHKSTERWSYLAPNYLAWARLEEAEDLSRREETEEARGLFQQATGLFKEAKGSIEIKLRKIQDEEERELLVSLSQASDIRCDYCLGRITMEEGRILDRQGEHLASSRRYSQAAERFQKVIDAMERESDRRELEPILYLCQAWERMMMAEARTSPGLYDEAADLFEQARKHALDQPTSLLTQAHSSFCRALEAGTRFELTRKDDSFSEAKRYIEAATSHYLRAGYRTMSDYTRATSRLLDAYLYTYNAQTEADPRKKAQLYQMAERLLQSSAGSYLKAKHPEKSEEVRRVLDSVKEEREIAVSLSEVLHAPTLVSTTTSFSTPTPTYEQAIGLERFENADIQANLILRGREVKVGDDMDIEIELVNAGKAPAQLIKVEEIIPEGFEVRSAP
ncbi:MAG: LMBR1 domain-containing protein, partial [Candidatus Bathyarchaeota archaeon]|nr:LMBR1 domain-containing protein [Candidatus Bathyarchaeota archaeon]